MTTATRSPNGTTPRGFRPDRGDHCAAGRAAAVARRRAREVVRRVLHARRRHRRRCRAARRAGERAAAPSWCTSAANRPARRVLSRPPSRCLARPMNTANGSSAMSSASRVVRAARRSRCRAPIRTWCAGCSRSRCPKSPMVRSEIVAVAREAGHRSKIAVHTTVTGVNAKGACIGPMGATRTQRHERTRPARRSTSSITTTDPATFVGNALSPSKVVSVTIVDAEGQGGARRGAGLPAVAGHRQGGAERPPCRPADRLAYQYPQRRRPPTSADRSGPRCTGVDRSCRVVFFRFFRVGGTARWRAAIRMPGMTAW